MTNSTLPHGKVNNAMKKVNLRVGRILALMMLLLALTLGAKANPVDMRRAREVGAKFITANTPMRVSPYSGLELVTTYCTTNNDAAFHVFNTSKGFVIVAADDCATPILGYSVEGRFDVFNIPVQLQEYLKGFKEQIQYGIDNHLTADATIARQWELVQATGHIIENRATSTVAPLLSDSWDQGCYYNELCPEDPEGQCYHPWAGCVATSMAQIMHYWSYPITGTGSHTYTPEPYPTTQYPEQTANFGATTYQWNNMPNSLNSSSSSTEVNAVATLIWHCGVAVEMKYGINGSGAPSQNVVSSLVNYFGYSDDMSGIYKDNYDNDQWLNLIKGSLDLGRPVHYSGFSRGGHAFVCDGYDSDNYLHFNWGWSGSYNGYFALDALTPGNHNYSYNNYAIINIHPNCPPGATYQVTATASPSYGGTVYGSNSYDCGSGCTLSAVPADGYMFCYWTENGAIVSNEPSYSFTVMGSRNLEANFIEANGDACTLVFTLDDSFGDGWNGNALTVSYSDGCIDSEELTLDNGTTVNITRHVIDGSHVVLGWIEGGWVSECSFTISYEGGDVIYSGSNLSSSFSYEFDVNCDGITPTYYDITASANPSNGGTVNGAGSFIEGATCMLTAIPNSGYSFTNWTKNGVSVSTNSIYSFIVTESADYVANFSSNGSGNIVEIGDSTTTTYQFPVNSLYNYSFTEMIYSADEIGTSGMITSVGFHFNGNNSLSREVTLFMKNVSRSTFSSSTDFEEVTSSDIVYTGSLMSEAVDGWVTLLLDTPFAYDGTSNLMIALDDNSGTWSSRYFYYTSTPNTGLCYYSDTYNPDPYDLGSYSGTKTISGNRPNVQLGISAGFDNELTIFDGSATNGYVPVYGYYADAYLKAEFVIPADDLFAMFGGDIAAMKFYASQSSVSWGDANFQVFLTEVDNTSISAFYGPGTIVYEGALSINDGEMNVTFTTPYHYNGGNLLIGFYNTVQGTYVTSTWYGESVNGASVQGYSYNGLDAISPTQRNFLPKTTFYFSNGNPVPHLVATPAPIDLGYRPNGAWMRPLEVNIFNEGIETTINDVSITNNDYFLLNLEGVSVPFTLGHNNGFDLNLGTVGSNSGTIDANLVVNYGNNEEAQFDVIATAYTPVCPDVWEVAQLVTTFPYTATLNVNSIPIYDNYRLPPTNIADGADAVYKLVFTEDTYLNASVTNGENGKVALYPEDFNGVGGPDLGNTYTGPQVGGNDVPFTAMIGDEYSSTTATFFPFHSLWNYSLAENLFLASELAEAGVTSAPMTSLSWNVLSMTCNTPQSNISIWMANVGDEALTSTSHTTSSMTLVYTGNDVLPAVGQWNEFVFNEGTFSWDGYSNVLILCVRNNGSWQGSISWQTHNPGFTAMSYHYSDTNGGYDVSTEPYTGMYTSSTNRANIIMKSGSRSVTFGELSTRTNDHGMNRNTNIELNRDGWLYYDDGTYATNVGAGGDLYWGTMFPASMITENNLTKIALYENSNNTGDITLTVYSGGATNPGTQIYTQSITSVGGDAFHEITLASPVTIDPSQNLWIVFHQVGDNYPATACADAGHPNNRWVSIDGTSWLDLAEAGLPGYEWMIRAYIEGNVSNGTITDMTVTPGTYYLVASSTSDEFTVEINADEMPCPELATNPNPVDAATEVNTVVNLSWNLDSRATEYRLMFGTTYYCEETLVDWTDNLAEHYFVFGLNNNTNYFWRIDQRNDGCPEGVLGQVWGFTTHLNVPLNLYANSFILQGEDLTLYWDAPNDRSFQYYNIYQDGELIGSSYDTYYTVSGLSYNIDPGYNFNITAVYDEGESTFSNTCLVRVTGEGTIEGYVYEQDGVTPIQGARVGFQGTGQVGGTYSYYNHTDGNGHYSFNMVAGTYTGTAICSGYQSAQHESFTITYNETTSDINFVMDEIFNTAMNVVAEYYPDAQNTESPYVKVRWEAMSNSMFNFDDNTMQGWISIDADGDGYGWEPSSAPYSYFASSVNLSGHGHNASEAFVVSGSYSNNYGVLYPDNYLVSPQITLGGTMTFYACAQDEYYSAEHFGVAVSTTSTDPNAFTMLSEWTMTAKSLSDAEVSHVIGEKSRLRGIDNRSQGNWYQYTVDLSAYSGMGYVAIRHFNCSDQFVLDIDDIFISEPSKAALPRAFSYYRVYRTDAYNNGPYSLENTEVLASGLQDTLYIDVSWPNVTPGVYKWGVGCVYEGNRGEEIEGPISWGEPMSINNAEPTRARLTHNFDDSTMGDWTTIGANSGNRDYLQYCTETYSGGVGTGGGAMYWGIRFPAADIAAYNGQSLNKVGIFMNIDGDSGWTYSGNYTVNVYQGGASAPGTLVSTASEDLSGDMSWHDITLITPVTIDASQDLWLCFYTPDIAYPMAGCDYVGNSNSDLLSLDGTTWEHVNDYGLAYTWMIRGLVEEGGSLQEPRESEIVWSNHMDKNMYLLNNEVNITVQLNSGDSPVGTTVSFTNLNSTEQQLYPIADVILDETGYYNWDSFRKGDYQLIITKEGHTTIIENVSIWDATELFYVMTETTQSISNLYVSSTGWAKWNGPGYNLNQIVSSYSFFVDFDDGMPSDWTTIDADGDGLTWVSSMNPGIYHNSGVDLTGTGHNSSDAYVISCSYANQTGQILYPDNYLVSPQINITEGSIFSFWACAQDASYAADHFGVFISDNGTSNWTMIQEWTMTAKSGGDVMSVGRGGNTRAQGNWYYYTVNLSAYAGQKYIAIRHFNCWDQFILNVDDIELTSGRNGDRHYEYNQLILTDVQGIVLYTENTNKNYCQLPVDNLVDGNTYHCKVASVYSSGLTEWVETDWRYQACDNYEGASNLFATTTGEGNLVSWTYPEISESKNLGNREMWDLMMTFNAPEAAQYGVAYDGNNFYTSNWGYSSATHNFFKYDLQGNMLEGFEIADCGTLRGMTYDGQYFYGVANSATVYCVDLANHSLVSTFSTSYGAMRGITYDPVRDGFWVIGNWSGDLTLIDRTGAIVQVGPAPESVSDLAYYKDENNVEHVFCFNNSTNDIVDYNITTNTLGGSVFNFSSTPGFNSGSSGGCTVGSFNGKMAFIGDIQQDPNLIGIYELGDAVYTMNPIGAMVYRDNELVGFTHDNSYLDEGDMNSHQYTIRVVYDGAAVCPNNNIYYSMSCPQTTSVEGEEVTQVSNFSQGYNWWSTYIEQNGIDGLGMLQEGLGSNGVTIRSQASGYTDNYPGYGWYGSLSSINNESSYRVITNATCSVTMTGSLAVPSQHPITLGQGWTWIGYVPSTAMSVDVAMSGVNAVSGDKLKSQQGYSDYYDGYGWFGSLSTIEPGMGLMYYTTNGNPVTFTYPNSGREGELKLNLTAENNHWKSNIYAYPDNMTVMAVVELADMELSSDNYELAAFAANGECRGSIKLTYAEPLHRHVAFLTISGKDAAELSFRLYDAETGIEYYDAEESLSFVANAIVGDATDLYVIHFRGMAGMDELAKSVQVYPNPVNRGERFSINMNVESKAPIQVEIINALGVETLRATSVQTPASIVAPTVAGVYTLRITVEGKEAIIRKLVVK